MDKITIGNREYDLNSTYVGRGNVEYEVRSQKSNYNGDMLYLHEVGGIKTKHIRAIKYLRRKDNNEKEAEGSF